ncbi:MAG TPA: response regulator transcription factor [Vicinamibacterales bacterium]|nr:response regulator transcription factor [Vicinamibacterales bacterium]
MTPEGLAPDYTGRGDPDVETAVDRPRTVLVIEDEANIRELICLHLQLEQFECVQAADGQEGLRLAREQPFDLVILDLMLPGIDGITVCRAIRRDSLNKSVPILMLTARREEADKVLGLESGADDYLTKPFGIRELMARVRALLRRAAPAAERTGDGVVRAHGIEIDPARRRVRVRGRDVQLTAQEFSLLNLLLSNPGIVFSREALLRRIWKEDTFVTVRSVDTLVKRVRRKIEENPSNPAVVLTVWGAGYKAADV